MPASIVSVSSDETCLKESQFDDDSLYDYPYPIPRNPSRRTTNTGPKGVRADARAYEASKREASALKSLKNTALLSVPLGVDSGSEASEDEYMSRWREKRMKELSKKGVRGVDLFGQVDDVDAKGYLAAVDYEDVAELGSSPSKGHARRNVVSVVLIHHAVPSRVLRTNPVAGVEYFVQGIFETCATAPWGTLFENVLAICGRYVSLRDPSCAGVLQRRINRQPSALHRRNPPRKEN
jgi:hypothetical protein